MDLFREGEVRMPGSEEKIQGPGKRGRGVGLVFRGFRAGVERFGGGLLTGLVEGWVGH